MKTTVQQSFQEIFAELQSIKSVIGLTPSGDVVVTDADRKKFAEMMRTVAVVDPQALATSTRAAYEKLVELYAIADVVDLDAVLTAFDSGKGSAVPFTVGGSSNLLGGFYFGQTNFQINPATGVIDLVTPGFPPEKWNVISTVVKDGASFLFWFAENDGVSAFTTVAPLSGSRIQEVGIIRIEHATLKMTGLKGYPFLTVKATEEAFKANQTAILAWLYYNFADVTIFGGFQLGEETTRSNRHLASSIGMYVPELVDGEVVVSPAFLDEVYTQVTQQNYLYAVWGEEQLLKKDLANQMVADSMGSKSYGGFHYEDDSGKPVYEIVTNGVGYDFPDGDEGATSLLTALVGVALQQGHLSGVDVLLSSVLPAEWVSGTTLEGKTIDDVLNHRTGCVGDVVPRADLVGGTMPNQAYATYAVAAVNSWTDLPYVGKPTGKDADGKPMGMLRLLYGDDTGSNPVYYRVNDASESGSAAAIKDWSPDAESLKGPPTPVYSGVGLYFGGVALQIIVLTALGKSPTDWKAFEEWARTSLLDPLGVPSTRLLFKGDYTNFMFGANIGPARSQIELMRLFMNGDGTYNSTQIMDAAYAAELHDFSKYGPIDAQSGTFFRGLSQVYGTTFDESSRGFAIVGLNYSMSPGSSTVGLLDTKTIANSYRRCRYTPTALEKIADFDTKVEWFYASENTFFASFSFGGNAAYDAANDAFYAALVGTPVCYPNEMFPGGLYIVNDPETRNDTILLANAAAMRNALEASQTDHAYLSWVTFDAWKTAMVSEFGPGDSSPTN